MAKVVLVDNFNRDEVEDRLYEENLNQKDAVRIAAEYNSKHAPGWDWYANAVPDDYVLSRGIADFV